MLRACELEFMGGGLRGGTSVEYLLELEWDVLEMGELVFLGNLELVLVEFTDPVED